MYNDKAKTYEVEKVAPIQPMPQKLIDWLLANIYNSSTLRVKKSQRTRNPKIKVVQKNETGVDKEVELDEDAVDLGVYKFAIPDALIESVLCDGLPAKFFMDREFWVKYTTAMKTLGRKDLWAKSTKKRSSRNIEFEAYEKNDKWLDTQWNYIHEHNRLDLLTHCLKQSSCAEATNLVAYYKYKSTDCHPMVSTTNIDRTKLGYGAIQEPLGIEKAIIFGSDTSTRKTQP